MLSNGVRRQTILPGREGELIRVLRSSSFFTLIQPYIYLTHPPGHFPSTDHRQSTINDVSRLRRVTTLDAPPLALIRDGGIIYYSSDNHLVIQCQNHLARELSDYVLSETE